MQPPSCQNINVHVFVTYKTAIWPVSWPWRCSALCTTCWRLYRSTALVRGWCKCQEQTHRQLTGRGRETEREMIVDSDVDEAVVWELVTDCALKYEDEEQRRRYEGETRVENSEEKWRRWWRERGGECEQKVWDGGWRERHGQNRKEKAVRREWKGMEKEKERSSFDLEQTVNRAQ